MPQLYKMNNKILACLKFSNCHNDAVSIKSNQISESRTVRNIWTGFYASYSIDPLPFPSYHLRFIITVRSPNVIPSFAGNILSVLYITNPLQAFNYHSIHRKQRNAAELNFAIIIGVSFVVFLLFVPEQKLG